MFRGRGTPAKLRLNFDDDSNPDGANAGLQPGTDSTWTSGLSGLNPAVNVNNNFWEDLPPSPRKVQGSSSRKVPASPRRVPYATTNSHSRKQPHQQQQHAASKPTRPPLHLTAHDSILGSPLADSHGPVYPMQCCAMLQPCSPAGQRYVLSVIIYRDDGGEVLEHSSFPGTKVAASSVSYNLHSGGLRVSVSSEVLAADSEYGEQLHKTERDWDGTDVEKQFVLTLKPGCTLHGIFGAVTVSSISGPDKGLSCFQLRLVLPASVPSPPSASPSSPAKQPDDVSWGAAAFRELALHLRLVDESEDWRCLARDLGFTEHEIDTRLDPAPDPFAALLSTYRARGGTPDELLRGMYSCSRMRGLQVPAFKSTSPHKGQATQGSLASATSSATLGSSGRLRDPELDSLEEASALTRRGRDRGGGGGGSEQQRPPRRPYSLTKTGSGGDKGGVSQQLQRAGSGGKPSSLSRSGSGPEPGAGGSRYGGSHLKSEYSACAPKPYSLSKHDSMTRHSVGRSEHDFHEDEDEEHEQDELDGEEDDDDCDRETIPVEHLNVGQRGVQELSLTPPATPLRRLEMAPRPVKSRDVFVFPPH